MRKDRSLLSCIKTYPSCYLNYFWILLSHNVVLLAAEWWLSQENAWFLLLIVLADSNANWSSKISRSKYCSPCWSGRKLWSAIALDRFARVKHLFEALPVENLEDTSLSISIAAGDNRLVGLLFESSSVSHKQTSHFDLKTTLSFRASHNWFRD